MSTTSQGRIPVNRCTWSNVQICGDKNGRIASTS
jgi:hypothetical protein